MSPLQFLHAFARALVVALFTLSVVLGLAVGAASGAAPADEPTPSPTETAAPPVGSPPIIINLPPALGNTGGGAPQDNAAPMLVVAGYATNPSPVLSRQTFALTVTVKNVGTRHADGILASVMSSSSFVGLGAPVPLGQLDPGESATFTLEVQAGTLASGATEIGLNFLYRVGEGPEQSVQRSVGVSVTGVTGVSGQALVVVESAAVLTEPETVGDTFNVAVVLRNAGTRKAHDVSATLKINERLSPAEGSGTRQLGDLAPGQVVTVTLGLVLNQASPTGRIDQTFTLAYRDSGGRAYTSDETTSLDLGTAGRRSPQLMVAAHTTVPVHPAPGEAFTLTLTVTNVGAGPARQVLVRLGGDEGLKPFLPLASSNVGFAAEIRPGTSREFVQSLLMDGAAAGGAYPLAITLSYVNGLGEPLTETELIGLLPLARPQVQLDLTKPLPDPAVVGETFDVGVDLINLGRQRLEVTTVEIVSDDLALTKNSLYVGPLDPTISGGLTAKATARTAGTATLVLIIHYRDELNRPQQIERTYSVEVVDPPEGASGPTPVETAPVSTGAGGLWAWLLQFLGLRGG